MFINGQVENACSGPGNQSGFTLAILVAKGIICSLLAFVGVGCAPLPTQPDGDGAPCESDLDCQTGLTCVLDVATHQGWHDLYLNTCRVPCSSNEQCLFLETERCHWCYDGGHPRDFCVYDECE